MTEEQYNMIENAPVTDNTWPIDGYEQYLENGGYVYVGFKNDDYYILMINNKKQETAFRLSIEAKNALQSMFMAFDVVA